MITTDTQTTHLVAMIRALERQCRGAHVKIEILNEGLLAAIPTALQELWLKQWLSCRLSEAEAAGVFEGPLVEGDDNSAGPN